MESRVPSKGRIFCVIASLALIISLLPAPSFAEVRKDDLVAGYTLEERGLPATSSPAIIAERAIVTDEDGKVYFERNAKDPAHIASITKVMSAIVAIENAPLDTKVTVSDNAYQVGESSASLVRGDEMTLDVALKGLMIPSGNDAAVAIAETVGSIIVDRSKQQAQGGSTSTMSGTDIVTNDEAYDAFVQKMNETAAAIGMGDTVFTNPHGLDTDDFAAEEMTSTAADVAKMCAHAMGLEAFRSIVSLDSEVITVLRDDEPHEIELESTDELLGSYDGACGIKTGFTDDAGYCFAGACERDGKMYFAVALGSTSSEQRFFDTETMFDWVIGSKTEVALANSGETAWMASGDCYTEVPVIALVAHSEWIDKSVPATLADPGAKVEVSSVFGNVSQEIDVEDVSGRVRAGDVIGIARYYQNNELLAECDIVACEDVDAPGVVDSISVAWQRLVGSFSGAPASAQTQVISEMPLIVEKS